MLKTSTVIFLEDTHQYFKITTGEELSGITGMINRQLFPDKYSGVDKTTLANKAARGKVIHADCQSYDMFGLDGTESPEVLAYAKRMKEQEVENISNEYLVSDDSHYATMLDKVFRFAHTPEGKVNIGDIKTTVNLDIEYLSWQLSVGAVLMEMQNPDLKADKLFGIWLKGDKATMVEVQRKPDSEVIRLMECDVKGIQFIPKPEVLQAEITNKLHTAEEIEQISFAQQEVLENNVFESKDLEKLIDSTGIDSESSVLIRNSFVDFLCQTEEWNNKAKEIVVTDASQTKIMLRAREGRLLLKTVRINADKKRKVLKESSLKYSNAVQGAYNLIESKIKPIEEYLELQETFAERQISDAKAALKLERELKITEVREFIPFNIDLTTLSQDDFDNLLIGAKLQSEAKVKIEKAAADLKMKEETEKETERIKLIAENQELKAKEDLRVAAEAKAKVEAVKAESAKEAAPDNVKLQELSKALSEYQLPVCTTPEGKAVIENTRVMLNKSANYIISKIN